jgi:hypothetical protein
MSERPTNETIKTIFNKELILKEASSMQQEKRNSISDPTKPCIMFKDYYQNKYNYLYKNFPDLFEMIYEDPDNHDSLEMLKKMLSIAELYHNNKMSHQTTSRMAGEVLFKKFYKDKKKNK